MFKKFVLSGLAFFVFFGIFSFVNVYSVNAQYGDYDFVGRTPGVDCGGVVSRRGYNDRCLITRMWLDPDRERVVSGSGETFHVNYYIEESTNFDLWFTVGDSRPEHNDYTCWISPLGASQWEAKISGTGEIPLSSFGVEGARVGHITLPLSMGYTEFSAELRCRENRFTSENWWDYIPFTITVGEDPTDPGGPGEPTCENCDLTVTVVAHNSQGTVVGSDAFSGLTPSPCTATNNTASCTATTTGGAVGTLTAQPGSGGEFGWWEGACGSETSRNTNPVCTLTMNSHLSAVAFFFREGEVPPENGGGGGPWTPPGPGGPGTYWPPPIPPGPGDWLINPIGMQCDDIFSCLLGMSYFLFWITMPLFIIAIIIGAFYMMFSAGDEKKYSRGKQIITYALVAFAIVLVAFGIPILIAEIFSG